MKVILIAGKAMSGKDFTAQLLKEELEQQGKKVLIAHYADLLKYICTKFFNWNGEKDEEGRRSLQYVGTDVVRNKQPNFWVDFIHNVLTLFEDEWDVVLIPDSRFPNEIDSFKDSKFDSLSIRVDRPNFKSTLTEDQLNHPSETALDNYKFDYYVFNDGTIEGLKNMVYKLSKVI